MTHLRPVQGVEQLVSREKIAEIMGVSPWTVDQMRSQGMPHLRWGRKLLRYRASECVAWWEAESKRREGERAA